MSDSVNEKYRINVSILIENQTSYPNYTIASTNYEKHVMGNLGEVDLVLGMMAKSQVDRVREDVRERIERERENEKEKEID